MKNKEIKSFLGLFALSIVIFYFTPPFVEKIYFLTLLVFFLKAKLDKNHFFIMFFWLVLVAPGYLFSARGTTTLPSIPFPGLGREIHFSELVAFVIILKTLFKKTSQKVFYKKPLILLILFSVFLLLFGGLQGSSITTILKSIRYFIPLLIILLLPQLIPYSNIPRSIKLMFVSVFILVGAQFFDILTGSPLASLFGASSFSFSGREVEADSIVFDISVGTVRTVYGPFILLISLILSMVLISLKDNTWFKKQYLWIIMFTSSMSIFMSATRGWIVAVAIILFGFAVINSVKFLKAFSAALFALIILFSIPQINTQIMGSFDRVLTLEALAKGDLSAGNTLSRLTDRGPRVMNKFYESPVIGFGFSNDFYEYQDGHVGNQTLLLNGGVVGFALYLFFILFLLSRYYKEFRHRSNIAVMIFGFGLLAIIAIHSSSRAVFAYSMGVETAISLGLFFFFSDYFYKKLWNYDHVKEN